MNKKSSNFFPTLAAFLLVPLIIFNFVAGVIGGLWLLLSGGVPVVIFGIGLTILMPFVFSLAMIPQLGLVGLYLKLQTKLNRNIMLIVGLLASFYSNVLISTWAFLVFYYLVNSQNHNTIPLLLWGYSTTMAPLGWMAKGETSDNRGTSLGLLFAQVAYLVISFLWLFGFGLNDVVLALLSQSVVFMIIAGGIVRSDLRHEVVTRRKTKILLIEDDLGLLDMYTAKFISEGFVVDAVDNGEDGVIKIKENYYDIILTGIMLPKLSGIEVLEAIRKYDLDHGTIIVLSGLTEQREADRAMALGAKEYLAKAMNTPDDVVEVVRKYI